MFNTILVAIDGSDISKRTFRVALDEAKAWNANLHAVYVVETGMLSSIPVDNTIEAIYGMMETEGKEALEFGTRIAEDAGITLIPHISQGHAGDTIVNTAEEIKADLIILGSHGKTEIDRLLIGSVTTYVVHHSKISTLVVRA